jgi:hypothetical protein
VVVPEQKEKTNEMKTTATDPPSSVSSTRGSSDAATCVVKASDAAIDNYSCRVLQRLTEDDETVIDVNVGPYVTSLLRCAEIQSTDDLSNMAEYESLLELLEDQCNMKKAVATDALRLIAEAVVTRMLPLSEMTTLNGRKNQNVTKLGLYTGGEGSLDSFQSMREHLPANTANGTLAAASIEPYTPTGGPSPLKPDNLIPSELFGVLDEASPHQVITMTTTTPLSGQYRFGQYSHGTSRAQVFQFHTPPPRPPAVVHSQYSLHRQTPPQHQYQQQYQQRNTMASPPPPTSSRLDTQNGQEFPPLGKPSVQDDFPPLGLSSGKTRRSKAGGAKKSNTGGATNRQQQQQQQPPPLGVTDKELAAALFRPSRPRQNSIENNEQDGATGSNGHLQQRSRGSSIGSYHSAVLPTTTTTEDHDGGSVSFATAASSNNNNNNMMNEYYFQQQLASCIEILLSMNQELSEEAASEAALMAQLDFNLAQYVVDTAMSAPAVCKYMLQEGYKCFRSDCVFSHDIDSHTCLFWLRGRCGKGNACRFLHGFNAKTLDGISETNDASAAVNTYGQIYGGNQYPLEDPSGGLDAPAWPTPSVVTTHPSADTSRSFANIASKGYEKNKFFEAKSSLPSSASDSTVPTVRIPQDLWNPHENRDAAWFNIADPLERYQQVATTVQRSDVIDLHFQSTKTFPQVLSVVLPTKLGGMEEVWIVTGTGHHVGTKTHQKGGGALEQAVAQWLSKEGYNFLRGKDRNGLGGALLVKR